MQRQEGTCIHCSALVERNPDGTLVRVSDGQSTCGDILEPNPQDHQLDDEEDD